MNNRRIAKSGDRIKCHYSGFDDAGENVDSTLQTGPVEITLGHGQVINGLETALIGMEEGEEKTVLIEAANAYTQASHPLFGKYIIYEIKLLSIGATT